MTTSSTLNKLLQDGNGIATTFSENIKVFTDQDLTVSVIDKVTQEVDSTLLLNDGGSLGYSIVFNTEEENVEITVNTPVAIGKQLFAIRSIEQQQTTKFPRATSFPAKAVGNAFDKHMVLIQDLAERVGRSLSTPSTGNLNLSLGQLTPNEVVGVSADGTTLETNGVTATDIVTAVATSTANAVITTTQASEASESAAQALVSENNVAQDAEAVDEAVQAILGEPDDEVFVAVTDFVAGTDTTITYVTEATPTGVFLDGIRQIPNLDYTINLGTKIVTFTSAIGVSVERVFITFADRIGTASTPNKSITLPKLEDMPDLTLIGNQTNTTGTPQHLTILQVKGMIGSASVLAEGLVRKGTASDLIAGETDKYPDGEVIRQAIPEIIAGRMMVQYRELSGVNSEDVVVGWNKQSLNTVVENTIGASASLSVNGSVVLPAGKYRFRGLSQAYYNRGHQCGLYNETAGEFIEVGTPAYALKSGTASTNARANSPSLLSTKLVTFAVETTIRLDGYYELASTDTPRGTPIDTGQPEIYATLEIDRIV